MITQTVRTERRRKENECFGLPHGGSIAGLVLGLIIILWGITSVLDVDFGTYPSPTRVVYAFTIPMISSM